VRFIDKQIRLNLFRLARIEQKELGMTIYIPGILVIDILYIPR